jgi:hypothetical protein
LIKLSKLTQEQWDDIHAMWSVGKRTNREIGALFGVSHVAIQKKAKREEWSKLDPGMVDSAIEADANLKVAVTKVTKTQKLPSEKVTKEISYQGTEKALLHEDMFDVRQMMLGTMRNKYNSGDLSVLDCKSGMEALAKEHEVKFGKSPDTAIQINNSNTPQVVDHSVIKSLADKLEG